MSSEKEDEQEWRESILKHLKRHESKLPFSCQYEGLTIRDIRFVGNGSLVLSTMEGKPLMFTVDKDAMLHGPSGGTIEVLTDEEFDFNGWKFRPMEDTYYSYYKPMLNFLAVKHETFTINTQYRVIVRLAKYIEEDNMLEYIGLTIRAYESLLRGEKPCPEKEVRDERAHLTILKDGGVDYLMDAGEKKPDPADLPEEGELP